MATKVELSQQPLITTSATPSVQLSDQDQRVQSAFRRGKIDVLSAEIAYLQNVSAKSGPISRSFTGSTAEARLDGMKTLTSLRREMAMDLFQKAVRPEIEALMKMHGDHRSFDEAVCIYGFNRLFTRDYSSAGTDIDFMLVIDTKDQQLLQEIRQFVKTVVQPELETIGMDMEVADYLMIDLDKYSSKLGDTRSSLFTLANMANPQKARPSTAFITGNQSMMSEKIFHFTDEQLAEHYATLVSKNTSMFESEQLSEFKGLVLRRLKKEGPQFRTGVIDHLQQMANCELYIGKSPYNKKKTIQTEMANLNADKIKSHAAKFSIKFCLARIADLFASTTLVAQSKFLTVENVKTIEKLGLVLSNIVCRLDTSSPALTKQLSYSDITYEQITKMTLEDRTMVAQLMAPLGRTLDPQSNSFADDCYAALWSLGSQLYDEAKELERDIFTSARSFVNRS